MAICDGLFDILDLGRLGVDGYNFSAVDKHVTNLADGVIDHITKPLFVYPYSCEVLVCLHHSEELLEGVGVLVECGHLHHKCGEYLLLQNLTRDRELALHKGIPLLKTIYGLNVGFDIHFAVTNLGVVDIICTADDIDLIAATVPYFLGYGYRKASHTSVCLLEVLTERAELKTGFRDCTNLHFLF